MRLGQQLAQLAQQGAKIEIEIGSVEDLKKKPIPSLNITYAKSADGTPWRWVVVEQGMMLNVYLGGWFAVFGIHPPVADLEIVETWVAGGKVKLTFKNGKTKKERFGAEKPSERRRKQRKRRYKRGTGRNQKQYYYSQGAFELWTTK